MMIAVTGKDVKDKTNKSDVDLTEKNNDKIKEN